MRRAEWEFELHRRRSMIGPNEELGFDNAPDPGGADDGQGLDWNQQALNSQSMVDAANTFSETHRAHGNGFISAERATEEQGGKTG